MEPAVGACGAAAPPGAAVAWLPNGFNRPCAALDPTAPDTNGVDAEPAPSNKHNEQENRARPKLNTVRPLKNIRSKKLDRHHTRDRWVHTIATSDESGIIVSDT
jgi:hypothetical protein